MVFSSLGGGAWGERVVGRDGRMDVGSSSLSSSCIRSLTCGEGEMERRQETKQKHGK